MSAILDQFKLLKKTLLNQGQCLILNNRDLKVITEKTMENECNDDEEDAEKIIDYVKMRKEGNKLDHIDRLLISFLPSKLIKFLQDELKI